jgi:predicted nucleic acid-binding protein
VKWVTGEQDREAANALLESGEDIIGPFLLQTEVAAALARKARFHEISPEDASAALELWMAMHQNNDVRLFRETADLRRALQLSRELNHALQDCVYLALAERLDAPLITADRKFAAKAQEKHPRIRTLTPAAL